MLKPLEIDVKQFGVAEQHQATVELNVRRGLPEFVPALVSHDGPLIVVGSGPSLPTFVEEIKEQRGKGRPILAVKGAHDFLCEMELNPTCSSRLSQGIDDITSERKTNTPSIYWPLESLPKCSTTSQTAK